MKQATTNGKQRCPLQTKVLWSAAPCRAYALLSGSSHPFRVHYFLSGSSAQLQERALVEQQGRYSGLRVVQVVGEKLSGSVQRLQAPLIKYSRISLYVCVCVTV